MNLRWEKAKIVAVAFVLAVGVVAAGFLSGRGPGAPANSPPPTPSGFVQVRDGYAMTVKPIEADGNRIVLTATVRGPWFDRNLAAFAWPVQGKEAGELPQLTTDAGANLSWIEGYRDGMYLGHSQGVQESVPDRLCPRYLRRMPIAKPRWSLIRVIWRSFPRG